MDSLRKIGWAWCPRLVFLLGGIVPIYGQPQEVTFKHLGVHSEEAALYIRRLEDGREWVSDYERIEEAYPPASTAKIPHTLIALETGFVTKPETSFPWDGVVRWLEKWNQDQTLASAYRDSVLWVYQRIVAGIGHGTMAKWMKDLDYGNGDIGSKEELTSYWLRGPLMISAREQVAFMLRLAQGDLPISKQTFEVAKPILLEEQRQGWSLYSKTGWSSSHGIGWYVGWLEVREGPHEGTYGFGFNMKIHGEEDLPLRRRVVGQVFEDLGFIEKGSRYSSCWNAGSQCRKRSETLS